MKNKLIKVTAYLSHPIRGIKGANATYENMERNNQKAIEVATRLRFLFPELDVHCPAEMEEFVLRAYNLMFLTEKQILDIDCNIISDRDILLIYNPEHHFGNGVTIEKEHAVSLGKPIIVFEKLTPKVEQKIAKLIREIALG